MEQKDIDIYEILKDEERGTELYTPVCGNVWHSGMANDKDSAKAIWTEDGAGREHFFDKNGKIYKEGEILLFPSKQMRDWSKFFKKGDVLEYVGFKDGDIVFEEGNRNYCSAIGVLKKDEQGCFMLDTFLTKDKVCYNSEYIYLPIRLATEEEKKQFFSALEKEGKAFDAEKKQIVGLKPAFELGKLYVFDEEDEDGKVMVIGKLIGKNESEGTLKFGYQYEIENEKFVTDQAFDLDISLHEVLREATENEVELFNKHCAIWEKKEKEAMEQPDFKPFDKVLVRNGGKCKWLPAFFVRDRGEYFAWRYKVVPIHNGRTSDFASCIPYEGNENIAFTSDPF